MFQPLEPRCFLAAQFTTAPTSQTGDFAAAADFNLDGVQDIVVSNYSDGTIKSPWGTVATGSYDFVAATDFNVDGKPDLVAVSFNNNSISIFTGNGNGTFALDHSLTAAGARQVSFADFNGDGKPDIVVARSYTKKITVFNNNGSIFLDQTISNTPVDSTTGDFNGDGKPDFAFCDYFTDKVFVYLGNGNGTFSAQAPVSTGTGPSSITSLDRDGNGSLESWATANYLIPSMTINGVTTALSGTTPTFVLAYDYNMDFKQDLLVLCGNKVIPVLSTGAIDSPILAVPDGNCRSLTAAALKVFVVGPTASETLTVITHPGDSNLDNIVDIRDLRNLAQDYNQPGYWANGDFNSDGMVNNVDLGILAAHWQQTYTPAAPLPASLTVRRTAVRVVTDVL